MNSTYKEPEFSSSSFHCQFCNVYAQQEWFELSKHKTHPPKLLEKLKTKDEDAPLRKARVNLPVNTAGLMVEQFYLSECQHCSNFSLWINEEMIFPYGSGPIPNADMPEELKEDFEESRSILNLSPRGSAALSRLILQKLLKIIVERSKGVYQDIGILVKEGLPERIQKAMDSVRIIGNDAVHPGQIDVKDNKNIALKLLELINFIVEDTISKDLKINEIYSELPKNKLDGINDRDGKVN